MLDLKEAETKVMTAYPEAQILTFAVLPARFIFQVNLNLPHEEAFPVLLAVDKARGTITDISIFDDPDRVEISRQLMRKG